MLRTVAADAEVGGAIFLHIVFPDVFAAFVPAFGDGVAQEKNADGALFSTGEELLMLVHEAAVRLGEVGVERAPVLEIGIDLDRRLITWHGRIGGDDGLLLGCRLDIIGLGNGCIRGLWRR